MGINIHPAGGRPVPLPPGPAPEPRIPPHDPSNLPKPELPKPPMPPKPVSPFPTPEPPIRVPDLTTDPRSVARSLISDYDQGGLKSDGKLSLSEARQGLGTIAKLIKDADSLLGGGNGDGFATEDEITTLITLTHAGRDGRLNLKEYAAYRDEYGPESILPRHRPPAPDGPIYTRHDAGGTPPAEPTGRRDTQVGPTP